MGMNPTDFWYNITDLQRQMSKAGEKAEIISAGPKELILKKMGPWAKWAVTWNAWGGLSEISEDTCTFRG